MSNLVIANFKTGYEKDLAPFLIDNDAFPVLENAATFRGRVRRRRGVEFFGRLQRGLTNQSLGTTTGAGAFTGNIVTILSLVSTSQIVPGSISITVGAATITDATVNGNLAGSGATGTINYASGAITLASAPATTAITITFQYYPGLPVLGLEDFDTTTNKIPKLVAFDSRFSYQYNEGTSTFFDTTFYNTSGAAFQWSGQDYEQFYSASYADSLWVTNGNTGFHINLIGSITVGDSSTTITIVGHGLSVGDYIFINEIIGTAASVLNLKTFQVTSTPTADTFQIAAVTLGLTASGGIVQYLTRSTSTTEDGIRYYTGNPVGSSEGWVNFMPPLSNAANPEYLIGANIVIPFQDRLLFFGVTTSTSAGVIRQRSDLMMYSQNGTPYYAGPIPTNRTSQVQSWYQNVPARGGFLGNGTDQAVVTVNFNGDVLIVGLERKKKKLLATGDDVFPFFYQTINSEMGDQSTFSSISMDQFVLSLGTYGYLACDENRADRIDNLIPDEIYDVSFIDNNDDRSTAIRDYRSEMIYFSYVSKSDNQYCNFPTRSLVYNYKEKTWSYYTESFTHFGYFRKSTGTTWATIKADTWSEWLTKWNFGGYSDNYPDVLCGNQQGFVLTRTETIADDPSLFFTAYSSGTVTSPNHCLQVGDWIQFKNVIGLLNMDLLITQVQEVVDENNFTIFEYPGQPISGSYIGNGVFRKLYNFKILTKQFQGFWSMMQGNVIGPQYYLVSSTTNGEATVQFFTGQDDNIVANSETNAPWLPFTDTLLTRAQDPTQEGRSRIWHKMNNGFSGDVIQFQFTLSNEQMQNLSIQQEEFELHAVIIGLEEGPAL